MAHQELPLLIRECNISDINNGTTILVVNVMSMTTELLLARNVLTVRRWLLLMIYVI